MFGAVRNRSTGGNNWLTVRAERKMMLPPYSICQVGVTAPTMRTAGLALVEAGPGPGTRTRGTRGNSGGLRNQ